MSHVPFPPSPSHTEFSAEVHAYRLHGSLRYTSFLKTLGSFFRPFALLSCILISTLNTANQLADKFSTEVFLSIQEHQNRGHNPESLAWESGRSQCSQMTSQVKAVPVLEPETVRTALCGPRCADKTCWCVIETVNVTFCCIHSTQSLGRLTQRVGILLVQIIITLFIFLGGYAFFWQSRLAIEVLLLTQALSPVFFSRSTTPVFTCMHLSSRNPHMASHEAKASRGRHQHQWLQRWAFSVVQTKPCCAFPRQIALVSEG